MTKKEENSAKKEPRINNRIRLYRGEKGHRQKDLAFLLGISAFQISRWERGKSEPTLYHAIGLEVACSRLIDDIYRPYFDDWKEKIKERRKELELMKQEKTKKVEKVLAKPKIQKNDRHVR